MSCLTVSGSPCIAADTESFVVGRKYEVSVGVTVGHCADIRSRPVWLSHRNALIVETYYVSSEYVMTS